jgi:N-acetylmuramoyl-L-alanine amidase
VEEGAATRVSAKVDGVIDIRHGRIENPARIYVDFLETMPALKGKGVVSIAAGTKLLKQVRVAENQKGITRLVFDLETDQVEYQTVAEMAEKRLEIILRPKGQGGKLKNPLAAPPMVSEAAAPRRPAAPLAPTLTAKVEPRSAGKFRMPEPPVLLASYRLPRAEPEQMPYRVSGFVLRDFRGTLPGRKEAPTRRIAPQVGAVAARNIGPGKQSLTRVLGLKIGKVVIDPGHGGHDAGSTGVTGLVEKEVTLDIAKRLAALIEENLGSEVILTRSEDVYLSPEQRTEIANQQKADLFISVHANSSRVKTATGVETYYLNFTASPDSLEVAARENASSQRSVSDLGDLIKKIALKDKLDESREFAGQVQQALYGGSQKAGNKTRDRGVRKAPFIVLIGAEMPSILTEVGFLSNPREEALLKKPEYRQKIAEALFKGVSQYADSLSHFNLAQTVGN